MNIKIRDVCEMMKKSGISGDANSFPIFHQVLAIRNHYRKKEYLVELDEFFFWWDADLFDVIDESIPSFWVEEQYKWRHKIRNRNYDFDIPLKYYHGPKAFLDNENFFFDIIENPGDAYEFYCRWKEEQ